VRLADSGLVPPGSRVVEVGAGCLRNSFFLQERGYDVTVYEIPAVIDRFRSDYERFNQRGGHVHTERFPTGPFSAAVSTFVVETICPEAARFDLLRHMVAALAHGGVLALAVRGVPDVKTAWLKGTAYRDGYITPAKTFVRPYTASEVTALLLSLGLKDVHVFARSDTPQVVNAVASK
jgi:hypothetical protein